MWKDAGATPGGSGGGANCERMGDAESFLERADSIRASDSLACRPDLFQSLPHLLPAYDAI
jgi:hypothetical protein